MRSPEKTAVKILITGMHETSGDEELNSVCEGVLTYREPWFYVTYKEKLDPDSDELTPTLLKINEEELRVTRKGNAKSEMHFKKGASYKGAYETELGTFEIEIITDDILYEEDVDKIKTEVSYRVGLNGMRPSESHMKIEIGLI